MSVELTVATESFTRIPVLKVVTNPADRLVSELENKICSVTLVGSVSTEEGFTPSQRDHSRMFFREVLPDIA